MNARVFALSVVSFACAVSCRSAPGEVVLTAGRVEVVEPAKACGPVKFAVQETSGLGGDGPCGMPVNTGVGAV